MSVEVLSASLPEVDIIPLVGRDEIALAIHHAEPLCTSSWSNLLEAIILLVSDQC